ncbi:MAG: A/G-specific adenine glycosylase [Balneolaceae bacterium]
MPDLPVNALLGWYQINKRKMPWRDITDPYKIWISEVMLQQTRVDTVIPYFNRFMEKYPTVDDLAESDQQSVLKVWEGLGYYSRARNMHQAAKTVSTEMNGKMPANYDGLIKLKGIGPYTAAAISSIAYSEKKAVVDGNVLRVLCRFFGIPDDIRSAGTKTQIQGFADDLIPESNPGDFNQAVMELGATVCKPSNPMCDECPLSVQCVAYNSAQTEVIPYKSKKAKVPHHQIAVGLIVNKNNELLISLRQNNAMLGGLWEFPGGKKEDDESLKETTKRELDEELGVEVSVFDEFMNLKHAYSHFKITLHAYWCRIEKGKPSPKSSQKLKWVSLEAIDEFPFPKANKTLIKNLQELKDNNLTQFLSES